MSKELLKEFAYGVCYRLESIIDIILSFTTSTARFKFDAKLIFLYT